MGVMRVLVAEGKNEIRENLVRFLSLGQKMKVVASAGTGAEAVAKTHLCRPDLVLLDFNLPEGSGLEWAPEISAAAEGVRIVVLDDPARDEYLYQAVRSGVHGYISKGAELETLVDALLVLENQDFLLSPKIAPVVLSDYSRVQQELNYGLDYHQLTKRELDVLGLLCSGASNERIAEALVISKNTVRIHVQNILKKLHLKNRREARERYLFACNEAVLTDSSVPGSLIYTNKTASSEE